MRQSLQVGDVCPVCRQSITGTLPAETVIQEMYLQAKEQHEADRRAHDDLERSMNRLTAEINAERSAYQRDKQAYDSDRSVVEAERGVADVCRQCGIAAISDDIRGQLQCRSSVAVAVVTWRSAGSEVFGQIFKRLHRQFLPKCHHS